MTYLIQLIEFQYFFYPIFIFILLLK